MSQVAGWSHASTNKHEAIVDEILAELKDVGDSIEEKWREIAQSLEIAYESGQKVTMSSPDSENNFRRVIMLWVKKCFGKHIWLGLLDALDKHITSNVLKELRAKHCSKYPTGES